VFSAHTLCRPSPSPAQLLLPVDLARGLQDREREGVALRLTWGKLP